MDFPIDILQYFGYPTTRESFKPPRKQKPHIQYKKNNHIDEIIQRKKEKQVGSQLFKFIIITFLILVIIFTVDNQTAKKNQKKNQENTIIKEEQPIINNENTKTDEIIQKVQKKSVQIISQQSQIQQKQVNENITNNHNRNNLFLLFWNYQNEKSTDLMPVQLQINQNKTNLSNGKALQTLKLQDTINTQNIDKSAKIANDNYDEQLQAKKESRIMQIEKSKDLKNEEKYCQPKSEQKLQEQVVQNEIKVQFYQKDMDLSTDEISINANTLQSKQNKQNDENQQNASLEITSMDQSKVDIQNITFDGSNKSENEKIKEIENILYTWFFALIVVLCCAIIKKNQQPQI